MVSTHPLKALIAHPVAMLATFPFIASAFITDISMLSHPTYALLGVSLSGVAGFFTSLFTYKKLSKGSRRRSISPRLAALLKTHSLCEYLDPLAVPHNEELALFDYLVSLDKPINKEATLEVAVEQLNQISNAVYQAVRASGPALTPSLSKPTLALPAPTTSGPESRLITYYQNLAESFLTLAD